MMRSPRQSRALLAILAVAVVVFAATDLVLAATTRCSLAGQERRVLALDDLDRNPDPGVFALAQPAVWQNDVQGKDVLVLQRGEPLQISGRFRESARRRDEIAVLTLDRATVTGATRDGSFSFTIPSAALPPGLHEVTIDFVTPDLTSYSEPVTRRLVRVAGRALALR